MTTLSRRALLGLTAGTGVLGLAAGAGTTAGLGRLTNAGGNGSGVAETYPFYGTHQSGIVTPAQDRLHFASFDIVTTSRNDLIALLREWTDASARMTQGRGAGPGGIVNGPYDAPPDDTGEALDLAPGGLTITIGFGPGLFRTPDGNDRFALAHQLPAALAPLPRFPGDALIDAMSGGDLCVQACSEDPQVAVHAIRNLSRVAFGRASLRWSQLGFGRTSSTTTSQVTPRNLFGFKDGTANIKAEETHTVDEHVWAHERDGAPWMAGGSYLVARKIRMTIETWDRASLREQERVTGRTKTEGAPLSGGSEFTEPDFAAVGREGKPLIDPRSHVSLAHPDHNEGAKMLRRGYNFVDGNDELGRLNAGLFFLAFQRDPRKAFVPVQMHLAKSDALGEYLRHVGSALFAVPPGAGEGGFIGETLFA